MDPETKVSVYVNLLPSEITPVLRRVTARKILGKPESNLLIQTSFLGHSRDNWYDIA